MDRLTDLEMPSPKRIRLEAPGSGAAICQATPLDDIDGPYGSPLVQITARDSHVLSPAIDTPALPIDQKPFQLPGLGMLDGTPASSIQSSQERLQVHVFPEAEQSFPPANMEDTGLDDGQKFQINGGQDATVENENVANIQTTETERFSPVHDEIPMDSDGTATAKVEERISEVDAPGSQEAAGSASKLARNMLDWHSSGTVIDNRFWLGGLFVDEVPSTAPESSATGDWHSSESAIDNGISSGGYLMSETSFTVPESQTTLDWHSSGTIIDNRIWLGRRTVGKGPSTIEDSNTTRADINAEIWQAKDVDQVGGHMQEQLLLGTEVVAGRTEQILFEKPAVGGLVDTDKDTEEAEFELDSSPLESDSSSDDSTDTSSSDDSDADDYEMLSPAEQARRLMAEDGGSDGDGKGKGRKAIAEVPRTLNEKPDEYVPKPTVAITEDMEIEELGLVENMVENLALIKANTSGEYQVLESGSLLCLQDRNVIGVVSETLGRVQQPYYSVRFTNATAITEAGIEKGMKIFYVAQHSTTVFTQPLKTFKGSDASNLHDEEVGDDELEFSDDEAEAEHKRQIKQQRMAKRNNRDGQPDGYSRGPQQRPREHGPPDGGLYPVQERPPDSAEAALNYDDANGMDIDNREDEDGLYTPLTRPSNLHELLSGRQPAVSNHRGRGNANRGRDDGRGSHRGSKRGRGDNRGRGGGRGIRGSERGGNPNWRNSGGKDQAHGHPIAPTPSTNSFSPSQTHALPPRPTPEAAVYQRPTRQGNSFPYPTPQQSPLPSPAHHNYQPGYPPQYANSYNQSYFQQPAHHTYPPHVPQQHYSQYHHPQQSIPHQGYTQQLPSQSDMAFAPRQTQYPASIPPGAHINPNLFRQQGQSLSPRSSQQGYSQPQPYLASPASSITGLPPASGPNEVNLQDLLRGLGRGGGG